MPAAIPKSPSTSSLGSSSSDVSYAPRATDYFAIARIKGEVHLVQASCATPASALTTVDVKVFRSELLSIFRFLEYQTLHPSDITILEHINDEELKHYEADDETVSVTRDVMERMRKLNGPPRSPFRAHGYFRRPAVVRQHQRQR